MKNRILAGILAFCMFFVLVPVSAIADLNPGDASLTVNGESTSITGFSFASAKKVKYGDNITFGINIGTGPYFYYLAEEEVDDPTELVGADWHAFSVDSSNKTVINLEPGNYYLGFSSTIDAVLTDFISGQFGFTVERATFSVPQNLEWDNGVVASWGAVLTTTTGGTIVTNNVDHYEVKLYKDSALVKTVTTAGTSYDFSADMATEGVYAFTVKAVPTSGASNPYYIESAVSSKVVNRVVKVTISFDRGVASVDPSAPFVVIVGVGDDEAYSIEAVLETGRTFGGWKCAETGVSFADATSEDTYIILSNNYSGATSITIYAWTVDDVLPVINYFGPASGDKAKTHLKASFTDLDEGVAGYYIGSVSDPALVTNWTAVTDKAAVNTEVEFALTGGDAYYLHIKDKAGNCATSVIYVTEMRYHAFCNNGAVADKTEYFISTNLSDTYTILTPSRIGFALVGLYSDAEFENKITVSSVTHQVATGYDFYAQWLRKDISVSEEPSDLSFTYDGKQHDLKITVANTEGTIAYQWYLSGEPIEGATSNIYKVKNVGDSGEYYVKVSLTVEGITTYYQTEAVDVEISPRSLTLTADGFTITYKDAAPTYTYKATGFADGESLANITTGSLVCSYNPAQVLNAAVGNYAITFAGFSANNYSLNYENGTLKVDPYNVNKTGSTVTVTLPANVYPYVAEPITPSLAIKDGDETLAAAYYTITFEDNMLVGVATVTVTFNGNYTGTVEKTFTIEKSEYSSEVSLEGWTFGDVAKTPSVTVNPENGTVTYYYRLATEERADATATKPVNAGSYLVYAVIAATDNYQSYTTQDVAFSIAKKTIEIVADSGTWEFDGFEHAAPDYTVNGSFVGSDSLRSVTITSSITNVGTVDNEIDSYLLSSSTLAENYEIVLTKGTLKVTTKNLTAPSNIAWDALGGKATWVRVTKDELTVTYKVVLYRMDGMDHVFVAEYTTDNNYYDFTDDIKGDCENEALASSYVFKVMTIPSGGANELNYAASSLSDYSEKIHTVYVTFADVLGVDEYAINEATSAYLIAGESANLSATVQTGYLFNTTIWTMNSTAVTIQDAKSSSTTLTIPSNLGDNVPGLVLTLGIYNESPVIDLFDATAASDNKSINFDIAASDSLGITGWMITTATSVTLETAGWNYVSETEEFSDTASINATGTYYLFVQDANGNIVRSSSSISVYEVSFGAGTGGSGSMDSLLKVQNKELVLPASTFTNPGKQFKTWAGTTGSYEDGGLYSANASDTLVAQWATANYSYTVYYYLMQTDGTYPSTPNSSRVFAANYNQVVANTDDELAQTYEGMSLDTATAYTSTITIDANGKSISVYYKRNTYTITYKYRMPSASSDTIVEQNYLFGAVIEPLEKPSAGTGYGFIGWTCTETGSLPGTMPASNLHAGGSFGVYETRYIINYFIENLTENTGYTKLTAMTESVPAFHSRSITYTTDDAVAMTGFTAAGIIMTQGESGSTNPSSFETSQTGKVDADSAKQLNINIYYTRNSYNLTLYVWQGSREEANRKYYHTWSIRYQTPIVATDYTDYEQSSWEHDTNYQLADYADWSTGLGAPTTMPAGDVSVSRDYVSTVISSYEVEIYLEEVEQGTYTLETTFLFYANVGATVTIGGTDASTVNFNNFSNAIEAFGRYQFDTDNPNNVTSVQVTDVTYGDDPATLKVYFERKSYTSTIHYYYNDGLGGGDQLIGSTTKTERWGAYYTIEPLALFDSLSAAPANFTNTNATSLAYDYRNNRYMITMSYYYGTASQTGYYNGGTKRLDTAADLAATYQFRMPYDNTTSKVYYTAPDMDEQYYLNVQYRVSNTVVYKNQPDRPIVLNIGGTDYQLRIANKSMIFDAELEPSTDPKYANYPGAQYRFGTWTYDELKPEYTEQTYGTFTVYTSTDGYVYIADPTNQFVRGSYAGYNYANQAGYDQVTDFVTNYQNTATADSNAKGLYISNTGFSGIMYGNSTLTVTLYYTTPWKIVYMVGGVACNGHKYARGSYVSSIGCTDDLFSENEGFSLGWYYDAAFTQPVTPFYITSNLNLYGRYEKNTIVNMEYVYYQLPEDVTVGGQPVEFITEELLTNADVASHITSTPEESDISFVDGSGTTITISVTTTSYYYDGTLVMISKEQPSLTFTNISLTLEDYLATGFHYDDTNTENTLITCAQSTPLALRAYFVRNTFNLTFNPNNTNINTESTDVHRYGEEIELPEPTKAGYTLDGYDFMVWDADQAKFVTWTGTDAPTSKDFNMPNVDVYVKAKFKTAAFSQTVTHYFADVTGSYQNTLLSTTLATSKLDVTAVLNDTEYEASLYANGAVSIEIGDFVYFFTTSTEEEGKYLIYEENLFAATEEAEFISEKNVGVGIHLSSDFEANYSFVKCNYYYNMTNNTRLINQSYKAYKEMELTYYYSRANYTLTGGVAATDKGATGDTSFTGDGTFAFGYSATLRVSVPKGYTFVGWFDGEDMEDGYSSTLVPVSTSTSYTFTLLEDTEFIAVVEPVALTIPTSAITSASGVSADRASLVYGYVNGTANVLTLAVSMPEDDTDYTYITGYQWYEVNGTTATPISGATASTYRFPTGKNVGEYVYRCEVQLGHSQNGRTASAVSDDYTMEVTKKDITYKATAYAGNYDTNGHSITLTVAKDAGVYTIYYSGTELTSANYTDGSTTKPTYRDVIVDSDGEPKAYTVYFYIHSTDGNHADAAGSSTVLLRPRTVTINAGSLRFSKVYDATTAVPGTFTDSTSKLYELTHSAYYTIQGLLPADTTKGYLINGSAVFNSKDVDFANAVILSNLYVVDAEGTANHNYKFNSNYSVNVSAYITPREVTSTWDTTTTFEFDGLMHAPSISIEPDELMQADGLTVTVTGSRDTVGSYMASTLISVDSSVAGARASNYSVAVSNKNFVITDRVLVVKPVAKTVTYDGETYTLVDFEFTNGTVLEDCTYTVESSASYKNAGTYTIYAKNLKIYDENNIDVTDNYAITYASDTLTINPKHIGISGITVQTKEYDGTKNATLIFTNAALTGVVAGDKVGFDTAGITAAFPEAGVGEQTLTLVYGTGFLTGASASNYTFDTDLAQEDATGEITKKQLTLKADNASITYGEETVAFTYGATGFLDGEDKSLISGTVAYKVRKKGTTDAWADYSKTLPVGSYDIIVVKDGLSVDDYSLAVATTYGTLTIGQRKLTIEGNQTEALSKTYDASTSVSQNIITGGLYKLNGIVNSDTVTLTGYNAAYASKNVADSITINVTNCTLSNSNYYLESTSFTLNGKITKKTLTIAAEGKTTTYGSAAPAFTNTMKGFATGEDASVLTGSASYTCEYDTSDATKRGYGSYTISVSGFSSDNYNIEYETGTLTVNKAVITVTADNASRVYRGAAVTYTYSTSGFKYADTDAVITGAGVPSCTATTDTVVGTYTISVNVSAMTADNYTFTAKNGTLSITPAKLVISGIVINDKVYDNSTAVASSQIDLTAVVYDGLLTQDVGKEGITLSNVAYASKNVGDDIQVNFTIVLNSYLAARYVITQNTSSLTDSQSSATSNITKRELKVNLGTMKIGYGTATPDYTAWAQQTYSNIATGETLSDTGWNHSAFAVSCDYANGTNDYVETYAVTTAETGLPIGDNYYYTITDGSLVVEKRQLVVGTISWGSLDNLGRLNWTESDTYGRVNVSYQLTIYKNGVDTGSSVTTEDNYYNLASTLKALGAGVYTIEVVAVADTDNNELECNVASSTGKKSTAIYLTEAEFVFASDTTTQGGKGSSISIGSASSVIMIAGESNVALAATLKNSTGYYLKSVTTNNANATASGTITGDAFSGTVSLAAANTSTSKITVTLALNAKAPTLNNVLTGNPGTAQFSYKVADRPIITATPNPVTGDNVSADGYDYTYAWSLKSSAAGAYVLDPSQTTDTYLFPMGQNAYSNYRVQCVVQATRKDNGLSTTQTKVYTVIITRADLAPSLSLTNWTYGESHNSPVVTDNLGDGAVTYYYSTAKDDSQPWTTKVPTEAGVYYVKMVIAQTTNFDEYIMTSSMAEKFEIEKARLETPQNVALDDTKAVLSWDAVDGIKENAGVNSASEVTVSYLITMTKDGNPYKTYTTSGLSYKVAQDINSVGEYALSVTAVSSNSGNALDSFPSTDDVKSTISATIEAADSSNTYTGNAFAKTYDNDPIVLSVTSVAAGSTLVWYHDGNVVVGATATSLSVKNVADSGTYVVEITKDGVTHSTYCSVSISKKALSVTANDHSITYGDAYSSNDVSFSGFASGEDRTNLGGTLSITSTYTQFSKVDTYPLVPSGYTSNNYTITFNNGTLTVNKKDISVTVTTGQKKTYGNSDPTFAYTTEGLVNGNTLSGALARATGETVGTYAINVGTLANSNYNIKTFTGADFTIENANIGTPSITKNTLTYNGKDQNPVSAFTASTVNSQPLTVKYCLTESGTYTSSISLKEAGTYTIYYKLTAPNHNEKTGSFEATVAKKALTITANPKTITFGDAPANADVSYSGFENGEDKAVLGGSLSYAYTYSQYGNVGSYKITPSGLTSSNYDISFVPGTLTVNNAKLTGISAAQTGTLTYKAAAQTATVSTAATSVHDTAVTFTYSASSTGTYTTTVPSFTTAGDHTVYYKASAANHDTESGSFTVKIGKKALTVTAEAKTITYGDAPANAGVSYSGFEGSEDKAVLGGSLSYAYTYSQYGNIGTYVITPSGLTSSNYEIEFKTGVLTVIARAITITADPKTKVYGTSDAALTYKVGNLGLVNGDTLSGALSRDSGEVVGEYTINQNTLGVANTNYAITYTSAKYSITNASLTNVSVSQNGKLTYSGLAQTANVSKVSTSVNNMTVTFTYSATENGTYSTTVPQFTNAGSYTVYYKADAANHNTATGSFTVTIGKKALTITAKPKTITYGDQPSNDGVTIDGLVNGETAAVLGGLWNYSYNYVQYYKVGSYKITAPQLTSDNYEITFVKGDLTVVPKGITVTAKANQSKVYGQADPTFTYDVVGLVNSDTLTGALTRTAGETVGSYQLNQGTLANSNYSITYTGNVFKITNATLQAVSVVQKNTLIYTAAEQTAEVTTAATAVKNQEVTFKYSATEGGTYTTTVPAFTTAGDHTVYYIASAPNHDDYKGSFTVNIGQKTLTITAKPKTITFGDAPANAGFTYSGLEGGEELADVVTGTIAYAYNYAQYGAVGSYTITPSGFSSSNYKVVFVPGVLTVQNATISDITVTQKATVIYSGVMQTINVDTSAVTVHNETYNFTYSATQAGTYGSMPQFTVAGTHRVYYKVNANNHNEASGYVDLVITKKDLTVTAKPKTITYGDAPANDGVDYSGFENSETSAVLGGSLAYTYTYSQYGNIGSYLIKVSGLTSDNYNIKFETGTLTVNPKSITVTADELFKFYGQSDPTLTYEVTGLVNGDTLSGKLKRAEGETVDEYLISQNTLGVANTNYTITYTADRYFSIIPVQVVVNSISAADLTYNEADQTPVPTASTTTINDQTVAWLYSLDGTNYAAAVPSVHDAGTHTIYYKASAENHADATGSFEVKVLARAITVTPNNNTITYGDAPSANSATISNMVAGSADLANLLAALSYSYTYSQYGAVGSYKISASGITDTNYSVTYAQGDLTVGVKTITVDAKSATKVYGQSDPTLTYDVDGLVNGDTLSGALTRVAGETVGDYDINIGTLANSNYTITYTGNKLSITNATLTNVTVSQNGTLTYSGLPQAALKDTTATAVNNMEVTFTFSATEDGTYTAEMPKFTNADSYDVYYKADAANHDTATGKFTVTIGKKDLTISANDNTITYGDAPSDNDVTIEGFVNGETLAVLTDNRSFAYTYTQNENVGEYTITPSGFSSDNYEISYENGTLTVINATLKDVEITQKDQMTYTGVLQEILTNRAATAVNSQEITYKFSLEEDGAYTTDNVSLLHAGVKTVYYIVSAPNHDDVKGSFTSTIAKAELTVTARDHSIIYGDTVTGCGVDFAGFLGTDTVDDLGGELGYTSDFTRAQGVGTYVLTPCGYESNDYYFTYEDAVLTVDKRDLVIRANPSSIVFGEKGKGAGVVITGFASGENARNLGGALYYGFGGYGVGSKVGTYTLRPYGYTSDNYNITYLTSTMKVVKAELSDISVEQEGDLIFNGEEQTPTLHTEGTAVLDSAITYRYALSQNSAYSTEIPTFVEDGEYTVYYCASAANHNDYLGSFMVKVLIAELPENPVIADFNDITRVTRGLRIWLYDGVEKVVLTDSYPTSEDENSLWGGVLNLRGFSATENVEFNNVAFEDEEPAFSLKPIARFEVLIKDGETPINEFEGEYWVCVLLPTKYRAAESIWAQVKTADGSEEFVEIRVDGNYGIFKVDQPGTYTIYKERGIINLWPYICILSALILIEWIVTGTNNKKRKKLEKKGRLNALTFPLAWMLGVLVIPEYGVEILIGLSIIFIISTICMVVAIRKRKEAEQKYGKDEQ